MAIINNTVTVTGELTPKDTLDKFGIVRSKYLIGGFRSVTTRQEMFDIPVERREKGMEVTVLNDNDNKTRKYTIPYSASTLNGSGINSDPWLEVINSSSNAEITIISTGSTNSIPVYSGKTSNNNYIFKSLKVSGGTSNLIIQETGDGTIYFTNTYKHPDYHPATMISGDTSHRFVTDLQINKWDSDVTQTQLQNAISNIYTGLIWQNPVPTYSAITTTYPSPETHWAVQTLDDGKVYERTSGGTWNHIYTVITNVSWDNILNKPITISGYNITDVFTDVETEDLFYDTLGTTNIDSQNRIRGRGRVNYENIVNAPTSLLPFKEPTIQINTLTPNVAEKGTVNTITINVTLENNDEDFNAFTGSTITKVINSNTIVSAITMNNAGIFNFTDNTNDTTSYYISSIANKTGNIRSNLKQTEFVYPYFYGVSSTILNSNQIYTTLIKDVSIKNYAKKYLLNPVNSYIYFAFPKSYTNNGLISLLTESNLNELDEFETSSISVTSSGLVNNWTQDYWLIKSINKINLPNTHYKFILYDADTTIEGNDIYLEKLGTAQDSLRLNGIDGSQYVVLNSETQKIDNKYLNGIITSVDGDTSADIRLYDKYVANAKNLGNVNDSEGLFKDITNNSQNDSGLTLNFKSLVAGNNITLVSNETGITINSTGGSDTGSTVNAITGATNTNVGEGLYINTTNSNLNFKSLIAGSNVTFNTTNSGITINSSGGSGGGGVISDTYYNISTLVNNNGLTVGQLYLITDHQTKHLIPNTSDINTGSVEPLILLATSTNKFDNLVYSTVYPEDTIHFDFNSNLCEDYFTPRTGKITYRKDKFNNSTHYDFRNVKFRRWSVDCNVTWSSGSFYIKNDLVKYNDIIYQVTKTTTSGDTTSPNNDDLHYVQFLDLTNTSYWSWVDNKNNFVIGNQPNKTNLTIGSYNDLYTFTITSEPTNSSGIIETDPNGIIGEGYKNFTIGNVNTTNIAYDNIPDVYYNNIVFFLTPDQDSEYYCSNNTFDDDCYNSTIIGNNFYYNTIGNNFQSNTIGNYFQSNTIGNNFYYNTIGNYFTSNTIGNNFYYNIIGSDFYSNTIGNNFQSNTIGNSFYSNTIGNSFYSNTIGNEFTNNIILNDFYINTSQDNIFNIDFTSSTHVYNSYNKTIFKSASGNYKLSYYNESDVLTVVNANA